MAATIKIEGLDEAIASINEEIGKINGRTTGGLLAGGLIIQRRSQELVPVKYGFLKASAYTRKTPEDPKVVEVGYSAAYALYVHENLEAHHTVGQAKFLEVAVEEKKDEVVQAVASRAKGDPVSGNGDSEE